MTDYEIIKLVADALRHKQRLAIVKLLLKENLSWSDLHKKLDKPRGFLHTHLKKLELGGIIQNYLQCKDLSNKDYSYYEMTEYGKEIIEFFSMDYRLIRERGSGGRAVDSEGDEK